MIIPALMGRPENCIRVISGARTLGRCATKVPSTEQLFIVDRIKCRKWRREEQNREADTSAFAKRHSIMRASWLALGRLCCTTRPGLRLIVVTKQELYLYY